MSDAEGQESANDPRDPRQDQAPSDFRKYSEMAKQHDWPVWAATYLAAFARLPDATEAAKTAGVDRGTPSRLARRDDYFQDAVEEARSVSLDRLESTVFLRSTIGTPLTKTVTKTRTLPDGTTETTVIESNERHVSDNLAMFYLKRYRPEFRDSFRVEQTGLDGGPLEISVEDKREEAVARFSAEVIRLSDYRDAGPASSNGSG